MRDFDLKRLQDTQLEILKDIDEICKKHNIQYFGSWGTCLGAIRHEGFIPWDDDIDISMKWDEYKRFEEICKSELGEKYFLQNPDTDKYFWNPYNKIRVNNTTSMDKSLTHMKCHYGICMDIFPVVAIPNSKLSRLKQNFLIANYKGLCFIPYVLNISSNDKSTKGKIINLIPNSIVRFLRRKLIGNKTISKLRNYLTEKINKYDFDKCDYCGEIISEPKGRGIFERKMFEDTIEVKFEDFHIPITKEYDAYLSKCYGDYMKLPKEHERIGHGATIVDFDKSYEHYQTEN